MESKSVNQRLIRAKQLDMYSFSMRLKNVYELYQENQYRN
jgi:hypothetical protein